MIYMEDIKICRKPDNVSFDDVGKLLSEIHASEDIEYSTTDMSGSEIEKKINGGECFVAIHNDKIVGVAAACREKSKSWFYAGPVIRMRFVGVLSEYQGKHIASNMVASIISYAKDNGYQAVTFSTSEHNKNAIAFYKKLGANYVDCGYYSKGKRCYVVGVFWVNTELQKKGREAIKFKIAFIKMHIKKLIASIKNK